MEIDISALIHNIRETKRVISSETQIMAIVKADGYGHGALAVGRIFVENGASCLGVATIEEGCQLRKSGIKVPILILGHTEPGQVDAVIADSISQTISTWEQAVILSGRAVALSRPVTIHIKIDTGMGRLGFLPDGESMAAIARIMSLPGLSVEGIFTHFATSDSADKTYTQKQWHQFSSFLNHLEQNKIHVPLKHAANSAAIINHPQTHIDMVRAGIMLYGLYPSPDTNDGRVNLRPAMTLKARVSHVKEVEPGTGLSYGITYITSNRQRIATLPIGYADGFSSVFSNNADAIIHGQKVPVVGRICMDQCLLDVTGIKTDVLMGDEVVLLGKQGEHQISADQWANRLGTINYEVVTRFGPRISKKYIADFRESDLT
ncbi:MAG: alanine racemase [Pseudomonadota bacterium]